MQPDEFRREYLLRLPLPIAQLYGRAYNAKSPRERHDNAFYLFEALVKLAASTATACYLEEISQGRSPRVPLLDRQLAQLALPSLGQWLAILRELCRHFHSRVDATTHPWGLLWSQLSNPHKDLPATLALFRRLKNGPDGDLAADQSCSIYQVLDGLVQYRNAVFGHGAGRFETFYADEMGPLLFPAINELLDEGRLSILGPASARLVYLADMRVMDDGCTQLGLRELVGSQGARIAPLELTVEQAAKLLPNRVGLLWPGRATPLRLDPLLQYRESELSEEILFLNRDRNGKQVEYLSYTTGRTERDRSMLPALATLLSEVTNRSVSETDLQRLTEQSLAETPSVESLFAPKIADHQELGEYELLSELGRGGMGVVYLARQASLGRLVALKMLPQDLADDEVSLARFRREIRNLASCDDPHIVKILASGTFPDGRLYYTMEYVPGSDLEMVWRELAGPSGTSSYITSSTLLGNTTWSQAVLSASRRQRERAENSRSRNLSHEDSETAEIGQSGADPITTEARKPLPLPPLPELPHAEDDPGGFVRRIVILGRDVAKALQSIHDQGIVHRDVKPANLVLTPDGQRVVLMDFGLAKTQSNSLAVSRQGGLLGTLRYAAPEQLAAANIQVGPPADVRGLGVTMWEMLTRQRLFGSAEDEIGLTQEVLTSDVPRLRSIDPRFDRDLDAIVACATARRLPDRIQTAGQLAELLQLWLDGKPLPIRLPTLPELAWRWIREHAIIAAAASLFIIMAITTAGVTLRGMLLRQQQSQEAWQQIEQQSRQLMDENVPRFSEELRLADVDIDKLQAMLPAIQQQANAIEQIAHGHGVEHTIGQRAQEKASEVSEGVRQLELQTKAVERLLRARVLRYQLTEDAFQMADGMPVIYGRDALKIYQQVLKELAGVDVLANATDLSVAAKILTAWNITDHLRRALDDWLVLSYGIDEQPVRERLSVLAELLDQGEGHEARSVLRRAIIVHDVETIESLAKDALRSDAITPDRFATGLLLADGLIENLRLGEAQEILRTLRDTAAKTDQIVSRFSRFRVNFLLGIVLNLTGSRDELHEAIQCFQAASAIDPSLEVVPLNQANSELRLARPSKAIELLHTVHDPMLRLVQHSQLGVAYAVAGRTQEARDIAQHLVDSDPKSVLAHHGAAIVLSELLDFEAAAAMAREGLRIDPQHPAMIWWAHSADRPKLQAALDQIPPQRLRRFWLARFAAEVDNIQQGMKEQDSPRVEMARGELRQLGIQDWQLLWQEYFALFSLQNWNGESWEGPLRQLGAEAPSLLAEQVPGPMLGTLINQQEFISHPSMRQLLLREIELAHHVYPASPYRRLQASAILVQYAAPELAGILYEAAKRQIVLLRKLGYGSDSAWTKMESSLEDSIHRTTNPEAIDDRSPQGMRARADAYWHLGQARLRNNDYISARKYLEKYLDVAVEQARANPSDVHSRRDVSYANAWLSNVGYAMDDYELAHRYSQKDIDNSEAMAMDNPNDAVIQSHLARAYHLMVRIEEARGNREAARRLLIQTKTIYERLASANPSDGSVQTHLFLCYQKLGNDHLKTGEYDAARDYFTQCLPTAKQRAAAAPNNLVRQRELADTETQLGHVLVLQKNPDDALTYLDAARALVESPAFSTQEKELSNHDSENVYFYLAMVHVLRGDMAAARANHDKSVALKRRAFDMQPDDPNLRQDLASFLAFRADFLGNLQEYRDAKIDLDEAIHLVPESAEFWHARGFIRYQMDDVEGAIADHTKAIQLKPGEAAFYRSRGEAFAWLERYDEALADFDQAIRINPNKTEYYRKRAESYLRSKKYPQAIADLDRVPEADRTDPQYWLERTETLYYLDHRVDAAAAVDQISRLGSGDADMLNQAGMWQLRLGDAEKAQILFLASVKLAPSHFSARRHLALTFAAQQQWQEAAQEYGKCIELGLTYPLSWSEAALVAQVQQDDARYEFLQDDLLRRFWDAPKSLDADGVAWASARFARPNSTMSLQRLLAYSANNNNRLTNRTHGAIQLRLGNWSAAESHLTQWVAAPENRLDPRALSLLAMALANQSKYDEARKTLDAARAALEHFQNEGNKYTGPDGKIKWVTDKEASWLIAEAEALYRTYTVECTLAPVGCPECGGHGRHIHLTLE